MKVYEDLSEWMMTDEGNKTKNILESIPDSMTDNKKDFLLSEVKTELSINDIISGSVANISWGLPAMDNLIGKQQGGKYEIFYGASGSGKTTLLFQRAVYNTQIGNKVAFLSFEMPSADLIKQHALKRAGINVVNGAIVATDGQRKIMQQFIDSIKDIDLKSFDRNPTLDDYKVLLESLADYDLIIVDNLGFIGRGDSGDELSLQGKVSGITKEFCNSTGVGVIMVHHAKKGAEGNNGTRGSSAFRGNMKLSDDVDMLCQIVRPYGEVAESPYLLIEKDRVTGNAGKRLYLAFNNGEFSLDIFQ